MFSDINEEINYARIRESIVEKIKNNDISHKNFNPDKVFYPEIKYRIREAEERLRIIDRKLIVLKNRFENEGFYIEKLNEIELKNNIKEIENKIKEVENNNIENLNYRESILRVHCLMLDCFKNRLKNLITKGKKYKIESKLDERLLKKMMDYDMI